MTDYIYSTIEYAGLELDTFVTPDGRAWVTLSSLATGLGKSRQNVKDWASRKAVFVEQLAVKVGKRQNVNAIAYPVSIAGDYVDYLVDRGDKAARALQSASFRVDLENSALEAAGISQTSAQRETKRADIHYHLLQKWADTYVDNKKAFPHNELSDQEKDLVFALADLERDYRELNRAPETDKNGLYHWGGHTSESRKPIEARMNYARQKLQKAGVAIPVHLQG